MYKVSKGSLYIEDIAPLVSTPFSVVYIDSNNRRVRVAADLVKKTRAEAKAFIIADHQKVVNELQRRLDLAEADLVKANAIIV